MDSVIWSVIVHWDHLWGTLDSLVLKICPKADELNHIQRKLNCPIPDCSEVLPHEPGLRMHLYKHHRKEDNNRLVKKVREGTELHYHCPEEKCLYSLQSTKYFSKMKYLKQHYLKVHADRNLKCSKCNRSFAFSSLLSYHSRHCGKEHVCSCGYKYSTPEALMTHARRKRHKLDFGHGIENREAVPETAAVHQTVGIEGLNGVSSNTFSTGSMSFSSSSAGGPKPSDPNPHMWATVSLSDIPRVAVPYQNVRIEGVNTTVSRNSSTGVMTYSSSTAGGPQLIAPKPHMWAAVALSELSVAPSFFTLRAEIGVQTDPELDTSLRKQNRRLASVTKRRASAQTQTGIPARGLKRSAKISTETQTSGNSILRKAMTAAHINVPVNNKQSGSSTKKRKKSMDVQAGVAHNVAKDWSQNSPFSKDTKPAPRDMNRVPAVRCLEFDDNLCSQRSSKLSPSNSDVQTFGLDPLWPTQRHTETQTNPLVSRATSTMDSLCHCNVQTDMEVLETVFSNRSLTCYGSESQSSETLSSAGKTESDAIELKSFFDDLKDSNTSGLKPLCNTDTQTELDTDDPLSLGYSLLTELATIETQTTEDYASFDHLFYSNMCTQTSDLPDLGFVDMEIQTMQQEEGGNALDDGSAVSIETQTESQSASVMETQTDLLQMCVGTSDMETQTA